MSKDNDDKKSQEDAVPENVKKALEIEEQQEKLDEATGRDKPADRYPEQRR